MTEYIISRTDLSAIQRTKIDLYGGVELVHCKDCKKFIKEEDQTYCIDMFGQCDENGFCAWAERKEE